MGLEIQAQSIKRGLEEVSYELSLKADYRKITAAPPEVRQGLYQKLEAKGDGEKKKKSVGANLK